MKVWKYLRFFVGNLLIIAITYVMFNKRRRKNHSDYVKSNKTLLGEKSKKEESLYEARIGENIHS